ncbi:MAG TPA: hypothetical protein O0Y06_05140 [Methanocorpusculum sp.]|nr:hypothetical protein [Methanocorpusculum sp.]HJK80269.1 hypothetical protein [Methanocorpusculum sp.]
MERLVTSLPEQKSPSPREETQKSFFPASGLIMISSFPIFQQHIAVPQNFFPSGKKSLLHAGLRFTAGIRGFTASFADAGLILFSVIIAKHVYVTKVKFSNNHKILGYTESGILLSLSHKITSILPQYPPVHIRRPGT